MLRINGSASVDVPDSMEPIYAMRTWERVAWSSQYRRIYDLPPLYQRKYGLPPHFPRHLLFPWSETWRGGNSIDRDFNHPGSASWKQGANTAACALRVFRQPHEAPLAECSCGFYGVTIPRLIPASLPAYGAWGVVRMWGKVVVGNHGFRSQFAAVAALVIPKHYLSTRIERKVHRVEIEPIAAHYNVPILKAWPDISDPRDYY